MTDQSLPAIWASDPPLAKEQMLPAMHAALEEDRATRHRELVARFASAAAMALLCPLLVWAAAHGKTPLVRGGYALMAVGTGAAVFAEWMYLSWSRQALPGAVDARSQLQTIAVMLFRQSALARTAAVWCAPIFVGTIFIAWWLYDERSHIGGYALWTTVAAAWCISAVGGRSIAAQLDRRRERIEELLADVRQP